MNKKIALAAVLFAAVFTAGCLEGDGGPAFDLYQKANDQIMEAGSLQFDMEMTMDMKLAGESSMNMVISGDIKQVFLGEENLEMETDFNTSFTMLGMSQNTDTKSWYKDGWYYMSSDDLGKSKVTMDVEEALQSAQASNFDFDESVVKTQKVDGNNLYMVLDGPSIGSVADSIFDNFNEVFGGVEVQFGDIEITAILNDDGSLKSENIVFSAEMAVMGTTMEVDYVSDIVYKKVGGVEIQFPDDLDTYTEGDYAGGLL